MLQLFLGYGTATDIGHDSDCNSSLPRMEVLTVTKVLLCVEVWCCQQSSSLCPTPLGQTAPDVCHGLCGVFSKTAGEREAASSGSNSTWEHKEHKV